MELSDRKLKVLAAIVEAYVKTGEPVGSKALAADLGVSSATVRNEMADLAEIGLLEQPHTSAGRIPSQKGYRVYIDRVMSLKPVTQEEQRYLDGMLFSSAYDQQKLLEGVSHMLAGLTRFAAVSTAPSGKKADIRAAVCADEPQNSYADSADLGGHNEAPDFPVRIRFIP